MIVGLADTHTVLWYLYRDPRLSVRARRFIDDAGAAGHAVAVSSISVAEVVYLEEKGRVAEGAVERIRRALGERDFVLDEVHLTSEIAETMRRVPRESVPDMPDRIIAATALHLGVPVISRDGKIRTSNVTTIW